MGLDQASINKMIVYGHTRCWLQSQQLVSVAPAVVSFTIKAAWEGMEHGTCKLLDKPHVLLAQMQLLTSLRLEVPLNLAILGELLGLKHLVCLEALASAVPDNIQQIDSNTLALSRLRLETLGDWPMGSEEWTIEFLASGKLSRLQDLMICTPVVGVQHFSVLTLLNALTALDARLCGLRADLQGLARLTGLKSLCLSRCSEDVRQDPLVNTLAPLTALTGLTLLDLGISGPRPRRHVFSMVNRVFGGVSFVAADGSASAALHPIHGSGVC
jgi:hypothetical protein